MVEQEVPAPFKVARVRPQMVSRGAKTEMLLRTDILKAMVQVVTTGGETNLHAHAATDAVWLVLAGQATFYTEGDKPVARLRRYDLLLVPRGTPYWFESSGEEPLVIFRVGAVEQNTKDERIDYTEDKPEIINQVLMPGLYFEG